MALFDATQMNTGSVDAATSGEALYRLGIMYSAGRIVPTDKVAAHMWFNLAALKGYREAVALRRELAEEMSEIEVAAAQRAAREWLSTH